MIVLINFWKNFSFFVYIYIFLNDLGCSVFFELYIYKSESNRWYYMNILLSVSFVFIVGYFVFIVGDRMIVFGGFYVFGIG